jgi:hypothetical protein
LLSIGLDADAQKTTVKLWSIEKGKAICVRTFKVFPRGGEYTVTSFAVVEDGTLLALGLENGTVLLYRGDLIRDRNMKNKPLRVAAEGGEAEPVTGLGFKENGVRSYTLFVSTPGRVVAFSLNQRGELLESLEDQGCVEKCAVLSEDGDFVIGRREAVYFYYAEGKGPCFVFEGEKRILGWFRSYLLVVGRDAHNAKLNSFTIYDLKNKFIAFSASFSEISHVVCEWGSIFLFTEGKKLFQLTEKDTQTKLESLFKKNLYSIAINLAQAQQFDYALIIDIFRKYGDHLYGKGDYDGAIGQYLRTIGRLEPSYVIRKFLDAQRIHNLTSYLEALHLKGLAGADHTTLLLNCYTKLKDVPKLDAFIKTDEALMFDVETAIRVCRQAGYHEHALFLARRHEEHEWCLKILIEDTQNCAEALEYISTLGFFEAESNVKKYGKALISRLPRETTALIEQLCTNYTPKRQGAAVVPASVTVDSHLEDGAGAGAGAGGGRKNMRSEPEEFIHIFVDHPEWLTRFLEVIVTHQPASSALVYNTLLELYLRDDELGPNASLISAAAAAAQQQQQQQQQQVVATSRDAERTRALRREKALAILQNPAAKYEVDHALTLVQMHSFRPGVLYLFERLHLYHEIVHFHMEESAYFDIIRACKKYGDKDPNLWVEVLAYLAGRSEDLSNEIAEVLANIDRDNLLPPLLVIQILSRNPKTMLGVVKDYITGRLLAEGTQIEDDQRRIRAYRDETEAMRKEIEELQTSARIFQLNKCSSCNSPLDLPAVHFLCMHSFHQRCLVGDSDRECPVCAPENQKVTEIRRQLEQSSGQHDAFFKQLEGSHDGFATVAEHFGRGIFNRLNNV